MADKYTTETLARIARHGNPGSKRTPERAVVIGQALMAGATREDACATAGINYNTLWRWMADDPEMVALVEEAEGHAAMMMTTRVYSAANAGDWKAAAWWLERRRPKHFGRRDRMDVTYETRELARSIAEEQGLDEGELIARAQSIVAQARERNRRAEPGD